jgi:hypothetical protein
MCHHLNGYLISSDSYGYAGSEKDGSDVPAMLRESCSQSRIRGEPPETWFSKEEFWHLDARVTRWWVASSLVGAAWVVANMVARMGSV